MKVLVGWFLTLLMLTSCAAADGEKSEISSLEQINALETAIHAESKSAYRTEETEFRRDGQKIYAKLFLPESNEPLPTVIIAHGFGGNHTQVESYAQAFAENGIAACAFDFIGGGRGSKSDGKITEMSVLTEAADLNAVIDGISSRTEIDAERIFLLGGSQGGFVASYVAGTRPEAIRGLIALYPAYVIHDDAWQRTPDPDNIPATMNLMGTTIGRIYNADAMSFNIYDVIPNYTGNVLIIHGTNDGIVPISYSERAATVFPSAELVKIEGAGHGFYGEAEAYSAQLAVDFVLGELAKQSDAPRIRVTDGTNEVVFRLNTGSAARSLYEQLPLTLDVSNYSSNEKIFYPPEQLDTSDVKEGDGPFGTLAYFSPWGNVVMYYSECGSYPGLYLMGEAIEGADSIEKLNGTIIIEAVPASLIPAEASGYTDVPASAWYADAVEYVREHGIMNGTGDGKFSPEDTFTRAQFATVLYRIAGEPAVTGEDAFGDTEAGQWYSDAVLWSAQQSIFQGYGDKFGTNDPVTQEQMVTVLWRYTGEPRPKETAVTDKASAYALEAIRWARGSGVIDEAAGYTFTAKQNATRALVAAILTDYLTASFGEGSPVGDTLTLSVDGTELDVVWEDNASVDALRELVCSAPLTVQMSMYGGFEQVGSLGTNLPKNDVQTTTGAGDIVLYSGSNIVIFYGSNSWAYTRLGKVQGMSAQELSALLGSGDVTVTLAIR